MPKLRKQRRRQVYKHNVNRKRLRNKVFSVGKIDCEEVKVAWDTHKSVKNNMEEMGLSYDPNSSLKISNTKSELKKSIIAMKNDKWQEEKAEKEAPKKSFVAEELKREANAPRERMFRLPKGQIEWLTYLIDKYGSDFRAMARDKKNYYQETWKQLRAKIKTFRGVPEQYSKYLEERNLEKDPLPDRVFLDEDSD